eukprot:1895165-Amphidinium_carterae.1
MSLNCGVLSSQAGSQLASLVEADSGLQWSAMCLQETFHSLTPFVKEVAKHCFFVGVNVPSGGKAPGIIVHARWAPFVTAWGCGRSSIWVDLELPEFALRVVSAHLPHVGRSISEYETATAELEEVVSGATRE